MAKPQYATLRFAKYKGPGISSNICRFVIEKGVLMWYHVDVTSRLLFNERRSKLGDNNVDIKFSSYDEKIERDINKRNILNPVYALEDHIFCLLAPSFALFSNRKRASAMIYC